MLKQQATMSKQRSTLLQKQQCRTSSSQNFVLSTKSNVASTLLPSAVFGNNVAAHGNNVKQSFVLSTNAKKLNMFNLHRICRRDETPQQKRQQCRSNVRHCRKNRSTCSIQQCCFDIVAGVPGVDRALADTVVKVVQILHKKPRQCSADLLNTRSLSRHRYKSETAQCYFTHVRIVHILKSKQRHAEDNTKITSTSLSSSSWNVYIVSKQIITLKTLSLSDIHKQSRPGHYTYIIILALHPRAYGAWVTPRAYGARSVPVAGR